ncbi:MAG TPA: ABC transporter ATP-binding protein [Streptosporangiaceae bacterium]|jgi:oligopeptide/dipeptide ABC transporter ATP-binding protein
MTLLRIDHLAVSLRLRAGDRAILRDVTFDIGPGEAVGLVGESGSGKSMTARAIAGLLPSGARLTGDIVFDGASVPGMSRAELRAYRARDIAMIHQDPSAHINPVRTVGDFLTEALRTNSGWSKAKAAARATDLLGEVGLSEPAHRLRQYPHELSGGMLQRVMIAAALAAEPRLLLADEPTTALDVTTQAEIMAILGELRRDRGLAVLFITHDLELAAATCDRTAVMYAGEVVEDQPSTGLHAHPRHPYTIALLHSRPTIESTADRLPAPPGTPLPAYEAPEGCAFTARCPYAVDQCATDHPVLEPLAAGPGRVACLRAAEIADSPEVAQ